MPDNDNSIKVTLTVADWQHIPTHTYHKVVEFDAYEWSEMTPEEREQKIEEQLNDFCLDTFSREYEIEGGSLDDPTI